MRGPSRGALAQARQRLGDAVTSAAVARTLGRELFAILGVLDEQAALRRALADSSRRPQARAELAHRLFGDQVSEATLGLFTSMTESRWSRAMDLSDAVEEIAVMAFASALIPLSVAMPDKSIKAAGAANRCFMVGRSDIPPAMGRLSPPLASNPTASESRLPKSMKLYCTNADHCGLNAHSTPAPAVQPQGLPKKRELLAVPPGPQPSVYPATTPQAEGDPTFKLLPYTSMWEAREPAYPAVNNTCPGSWCSTFTLNCCTIPCLKLRFIELMVPVKSPGGGDEVTGETGAGFPACPGKPDDKLIPVGVSPYIVAQADVANGHPPPNANASDS